MRVLLVEDEILIAMTITDCLESLGHEVVGPAVTMAEAIDLLGQVDVALLDRRITDGLTDTLALALRGAGVPFAWMTGYEPGHFETHGAPVLAKPFDMRELEGFIAQVGAAHGEGGAIGARAG